MRYQADQTKFCRHFSGTLALHDRNAVCQIGESVFENVGGKESPSGWLMRLPCNSGNCNNPCAKFKTLTEEEMQAKDKKSHEFMERAARMLPILSDLKATKKRGSSGMIECPNCKSGLFWSISDYNGHIRASCSTEGCYSMME